MELERWRKRVEERLEGERGRKTRARERRRDGRREAERGRES